MVSGSAASGEASPVGKGAEGPEPVECVTGACSVEAEAGRKGAPGEKRKRTELVDREVQATDKGTKLPRVGGAQEGHTQLIVSAKSPTVKKAKSEEVAGDVMQGVQWGRLISPYAQNPSCIPLTGRQFLIGRVRPCHWQIPQTINSGSQLCKLIIEVDSAGKPSMWLVSLSERGALSVNGQMLKKNDKMKLLGGYEISMGAIPATPGSKTSLAFIFQPCTLPPAKLSALSLEPLPKASEKEYHSASIPAAAEQPSEAAVEASGKEKKISAVEQGTDICKASLVRNEKVTEDAQLSKEALFTLSKIASMNVEPSRKIVLKASGSMERARQAEDSSPGLKDGGETSVGAPVKEQSTETSGEVAVECTDNSMERPSSYSPHPQLEFYREHFRKSMKDPDSMHTTFDNLGYYLGEGAKQALLHVAFLHLQHAELEKLAKLSAELPSTCQRILLSSPHGSDLYQEAVVSALAKHYQARLMVYDRVALKLGSEDLVGSTASASDGTLRGRLKLQGGVPNILSDFGDEDSPESADMDRSLDFVDLIRSKQMHDSVDAAEESDSKAVAPKVSVESKDTLDSVKASGVPRTQAKMGGIGLAKIPFSPLSSYTAARSPSPHINNNPRGGKSLRSAEGRALKKGDRVRFIGHSASGTGFSGPPSFFGLGSSRSGASGQGKASAGGNRGPFYNCPGQVVLAFDTKPSKVGVRFDYAVSGGTSLGNLCEDTMGYWCSVDDLRLEGSGREEALEGVAIDALFDVAAEEGASGPVIIYVKDVEKAVMGHVERFLHFKRRAEKLKGRFLLIGQHISDAKERGLGAIFARMGAAGGAGPITSTLLDLSFLNPPRTAAEERASSRAEQPRMIRMLGKLMPNRIVLYPPSEEPAAGEWKKMMERDIASMRGAANQLAMSQLAARCDVEIPEDEIKKMAMKDQALTGDTAEKLLGFAVSSQLMSSSGEVNASEVEQNDGKLVVRARALNKAVELLKIVQQEASMGKVPVDSQQKVALKDVQTDNEFEKRVLGEVIPAEEVGVSFDNIGALDAVKNTLREVVMLPLQRPELFKRGALTKPTRGVLLFGPPGTGKTMLAKAVASESGANFINVSMSTMASKWFGEGEKYVKALFTLAHKIAPSVVFIDEVDSMLGRREKLGEHEAMRKIKNEFMANWDGMKTKECDRVLVLAATNRPFDLDEAVIRRLPRRLLVDLPDVNNRITILKVILKDEELEPNFDYDALAALTEGYTGSDLRNLCIAAAYRPIRDFLEEEKKAKAAKAGEGDGTEVKEGMGVWEPKAKENVSDTPKKDDKGLGNASDMEDRSEANEPKMEGEKETTVSLRPLTLDDLIKSMDQICASVSSEAANMTELRQWNELYGEGGSRKKDTLTYFM